MAEELKACPFCGGDAELRLYDAQYFVQCVQCFNSTSADHDLESSAIAAWNTRAQLPSQGGEAVAWQARFNESGDACDAWQTCSKEHHDLVKRCPNEWPGYEVRALYTNELDLESSWSAGCKWVDPVALASCGSAYDQGWRDGASEAKRLNNTAKKPLQSPVAQVVGRVHHNLDHAEPVRAVLNSVGRQLPDDAPLYTQPADQVADGVVVSRELLERATNFGRPDLMEIALGELRTLLAKSEGVKT